jgi:NAD(P)-dependent dehydrogenase (short-subunit alcohol dehydrogenase family)
MDSTLNRHGRVDILLNNAGIIQVGPLETMTAADFEQAMATNFWGAAHCTLAVLPAMREQGFGRIGNIVSVGGLATVPHLAPYTASKFALTGLTRALRAELAPENILITGIYPGTMRTGGHAHALVKGDQTREYALFALSDSIPGLSSSAEAVAQAVWRGIQNGDAEVRVGWQSLLVPIVSTLAPNLFAEGLALLTRVLPGVSGPNPEQAVPGAHVPGKVAELLTRLVPPSGRPGTHP